MPSNPDVTMLLQAWRGGDSQALERLVPLVRTEIHRLAGRYLRRERPGHVLQTTALVNEAYMRLIDWKGVSWQNRAHFLGVAAQAMRHIRVDYARSKQSQKRDGLLERVTLTENIAVSGDQSKKLIAREGALNDLAALDSRKSRVVELKYFSGLTTEEIAEVLKISPETVARDWRFARNWLSLELAEAA